MFAPVSGPEEKMRTFSGPERIDFTEAKSPHDVCRQPGPTDIFSPDVFRDLFYLHGTGGQINPRELPHIAPMSFLHFP